MKRLIALSLLIVGLLPAQAQDVTKAFNEKVKIVGTQYTKGIDQLASEEEREALRFLYAYMPLADITDYPLEFHLQNVRASFEARKQMPWGKDVPDLLFRHFVLPVRVNNEALDSSRCVFFRELKERVHGMGMKDAILEVNHWCHERVTYAPSDGRTLSPLACIKNALGRCGEESTFTVAALRAIGIPARQVYTPRWAHTDDNHAWVEAWADGQWYFLGACEPEPVLNLGWFNAPASRAMLMHTRAFGDCGKRIVRHHDGKPRLRREELVEAPELGAASRKHQAPVHKVAGQLGLAAVERGAHCVHNQRHRVLEGVPYLL